MWLMCGRHIFLYKDLIIILKAKRGSIISCKEVTGFSLLSVRAGLILTLLLMRTACFQTKSRSQASMCRCLVQLAWELSSFAPLQLGTTESDLLINFSGFSETCL